MCIFSYRDWKKNNLMTFVFSNPFSEEEDFNIMPWQWGLLPLQRSSDTSHPQVKCHHRATWKIIKIFVTVLLLLLVLSPAVTILTVRYRLKYLQYHPCIFHWRALKKKVEKKPSLKFMIEQICVSLQTHNRPKNSGTDSLFYVTNNYIQWASFSVTHTFSFYCSMHK